jgi:hypothetical protein
MGMHEWLIQRESKYEVIPELHAWLNVYKDVSDKHSKETAERLSVTTPVAKRLELRIPEKLRDFVLKAFEQEQ